MPSNLCHIDALVVAERQLVMIVNGCFVSERLRRWRESEGTATCRAFSETPASARHARHSAAVV